MTCRVFRSVSLPLSFLFLCLYVLHVPYACCENKGDLENFVKNSSEQVQHEVGVKPVVRDVEIANRLQHILEATGWFQQVEVNVREGVVFLRGKAPSRETQEWAGKLAGKTEAVVAVVNKIELVQPNPWNISPVVEELKDLFSKIVRNSPLILVGILLLVATWYLTKGAVAIVGWIIDDRFKNRLVRVFIARVISVPIFLLGFYLMLQITGLTRVAFTVIGGTGLLGIFIGFAFRDIAENFFASMLLSFQQPFAVGDLIEVAGCKGYVRSVDARSTLLMTQEGNYVQIPNATVYKEKITNFTANPITRYDFIVGISYNESIATAQSLALAVVQEYPGVLKDPEPLVLVYDLESSAVKLRISFWIDISKYSSQKMRSALVRLVKTAFEEAGIRMPDESRKIIFPSEIPVQILDKIKIDTQVLAKHKPAFEEAVEEEEVIHEAEGGLSSDAPEIRRQGKKNVQPGHGVNLLEEK